MHCKSANEKGVAGALATCAGRYLAAVVAASPARVVVVTGVKAAEAMEHVFDVPRQPPGTFFEPQKAISGIERLLLYLPHSEWLRRNPEKVEALTLPGTVSDEQLKQLRAAAT